MSYASDLGLKVGSKIKYLSGGDLNKHDAFAYGEVITLHSDPWENCAPLFEDSDGNTEFFDVGKRKWEHYKEEDIVQSSMKLKFPCCVPTSEIKDAETLLALVTLFEANGAIVYDGYDFDRVQNGEYFGVSLRSDGNKFRTDFYDYRKNYNQSQIPTDITIYSVADLLGMIPEEVEDEGWIAWGGSSEAPVAVGTKVDVKYHDGSVAIGIGSQDDSQVEGCDYYCYSWHRDPTNPSSASVVAYRLHKPSVASQEAITECLEDNPSVGIDSDISGYKEPTEPLITITQEVKYTVVIKGTTFTFTQDELDALAEELLGFTTL